MVAVPKGSKGETESGGRLPASGTRTAPGELRLGRDLSDLMTAPGDNIFLLKASYRWNM